LSKYKDLTDLEICRKIASQEPRALEELYNRYSPLVFTLLKKILSSNRNSEKLLVDVFTIIWKKADRMNLVDGNPYTWIITLTRNCGVDFLRRDRDPEFSRLEYDDEYENYYILPELEKNTPKMDLQTAMEINDKAEGALNSLTDAQKYIIHLAYYEGYTVDEIAEKLNIPIQTVRSKIMTSVNLLKENLFAN
jgi:RNA polymerase sigma-70 factor (ECF subfamily)